MGCAIYPRTSPSGVEGMKETLLKVFRLELTLWVLLILCVFLGEPPDGLENPLKVTPIICTLLICITYLKVHRKG